MHKLLYLPSPLLLLVFLGLGCSNTLLAAPWSLKSPDGKLTVEIKQAALSAPYPAANNLYYSVRRGSQAVVQDSPLGLTLSGADGDLVSNLQFVNQANKKISEKYTLISGKSRNCMDRANEMTLGFKNATGRQVEIVFRAYGDGMAYRYRLPGAGPATITSEASGFHIPLNARGWAATYRANYEEFYPEGQVGRDFTQGDLAFPALFDVGSDQFVLLAESAIGASYCSTHLGGSPDGIYRVKFPDPTIEGTLPWATPWRVVITDSLPQLFQSTLVDNLSFPAVPGDTSWIKPGRVAWSWWSQDTGDLALQKRYVDLAHSMGWEYNLVDAGWTGWNNGDPAPQVTELVNYGRERNVGILLWTHYHDLDTSEKRRQRLPLWKSWGIQGIKVDFFDSDSKSTMQEREDILQAAWNIRLMVNFHGDQSPRGQNRTWPNFLTREGVRGAEYYKFGPEPYPAYNCTLPYTRNLIGPMDYTPVTFSARSRKTTAAHELALSVVFQSGWQHLADSADSYTNLPVGKEFLKQVPADWDEVRFLAGYPAQFTCLARRKGDTWFVGMNNAGTARSLAVPLTFLRKGSYQLDLYKDGKAASIEYSQAVVRSRDSIQVDVPANGGFAARLAPVHR